MLTSGPAAPEMLFAFAPHHDGRRFF